MLRKTPAAGKRGTQDGNVHPGQPEKCGWIRKYCGRGIFREIWKSRYLVLKMDQVYISDKEAPNLIFLALSPEEKESWINALNTALSRAKNRILDEVTVEADSLLVHPTRDRARIPLGRRPPSRGHLTAVASTSTSDGMLTLDLIQEEDGGERPEDEAILLDRPAGEHLGPREAQVGGQQLSAVFLDREVIPSAQSLGEWGRWVSEDMLLRTGSGPRPEASPRGSSEGERLVRLRDLVSLKLQRTQLLLSESAPQSGVVFGPSQAPLQARALLAEALANWSQAKQVLEEVQDLRRLCGDPVRLQGGPQPGMAGPQPCQGSLL
ncbi:pleckstrin homology domain-containing family O member 1-like isoform X2 [Narcine bancroftii]|uniref:pleckstrin homology domain-containing family O member 1-like isoform X2 n=1 Tax=Narcine bancroftii TaxID=1343680 RepID=UPI003831FA59